MLSSASYECSVSYKFTVLTSTFLDEINYLETKTAIKNPTTLLLYNVIAINLNKIDAANTEISRSSA